MNKPVVLFPMRIQIQRTEIVENVTTTKPDLTVDRSLKRQKYSITGKLKPGVLPNGTVIIPASVSIKDTVLKPNVSGTTTVTQNKYNQYCIRWYPDTCQVFNKVNPISDKEQAAYSEYSEKCKGADADTIKEALAKLISTVGSARARHIILEREKGISISDAVGSGAAGKSSFKLLPDHVKLYAVKRAFITNGLPNEIYELPVTPVPIPKNLGISMEELNPDNKSWINDFDKAVSVGMGIRITDKNIAAYIDGADWLLVVGFSGGDNCDDLIKELFMRKRAVGALDVVLQDSPTNNSEKDNSAYSSAEIAASELSDMLNNNTAGISAPDVLGAVFGFNEVQKKEAFGYLKNGNSYDQKRAMAAFILLYQGCTAEFWNAKVEAMRYIKIPNPPRVTAGGRIETTGYKIVENKNLAAVAANWHITEFNIYNELKCHISARGVVPSVMIDKNPYGILPVRNLMFWDLGIHDEGNLYASSLNTISEIGNLDGFEARYHGIKDRYDTLQSVADRMEETNRVMPLPDKIFTRTLKDAQSFMSEEIKELTMPIAEEGDLLSLKTSISEVDTYLKALNSGSTNAAAPQVLNENPISAKSLLVALVKKSLVRLKEIYDNGDCKSSVLNTMEDMVLAIDILTSPFGPNVTEMGILVKEVLDIFSPRYDPWILALASHRLLDVDLTCGKISRSTVNAQSIPVVNSKNQNLTGVFGMIEKPGKAQSTHSTDGYFQAPSAHQLVAASMLRNASLYKAEGQNSFMVNLSSQRYKEAVWFAEGLQKGYSRAELLGMRLERLLHDKKLDRLPYDLRKAYPLDQANSASGSSYVTNGESFLADTELEKLNKSELPKGMFPMLKIIQKRIGEISDSISDLFVSELAYNLAAGNAEMANAWLLAFENKLPPPKISMAGTPRTGQVIKQRVVMPMTANEADASEKNPRSIAEPVLAKLCDTMLSAFGYNNNISFKASVFLRGTQGTEPAKIYEALFKPASSLGFAAIDIVLGGQKELDAITKRIILNTLQAVGQQGLESIWEAKNPEEAFDSKAYILFDYSGGMDAIFKKASQMLLMIKASQPLGWDDITVTASGSQELYNIKMVSFKTLYSRLVRLSNNYQTALAELVSLKNSLLNMVSGEYRFLDSKTAEAKLKEVLTRINELLDTFVKSGFEEANICIFESPGNIPISPEPVVEGRISEKPLARMPVSKETGSLVSRLAGLIEREAGLCVRRTTANLRLEALIERLGKRMPQCALNDVLKYQLNETSVVTFNIARDCFEPALEESSKMSVINALLENVQSKLKEWTSKNTMTIFPPFICQKDLNVTGNSSVDQLKLYKKVRKNISMVSAVTNGFSGGMTASVWEPGILKSMDVIKSEVMKNLGGADTAAVIRDLAGLKLDGRPATDVHYILDKGSFAFGSGASYAGLKIDEWTDFVHSNSEVTGVGLKFQTPKSQAPNVILLAVPEYSYPSNSTGEWTHINLVRTVAEMIRLMYIRTEGFNIEKPLTGSASGQPQNENTIFVDRVEPVMYFKSTDTNPLLK